MSMTMNVTSLRSKASAEALRLATDAKDRYRAGALLLRGSPFAVGWFAGWLTTEFPPQVLTGHALSRVSPRVGTAWAAQRADRILTAHDSLVLASMETPVEMQLVMDWLGQQRARNPEVKFDLSKLPELPSGFDSGVPRTELTALVEQLQSGPESGDDRSIVPVRVF